MRFIGELVAAVVATSEEEAEDIVDRVELSIDETPSVADARDALKTGAPQVHAEAPGNVILEGKVKTPGFDADLEQRAQDRQDRSAVAPAKRDAAGAARAAMPPMTRRPGVLR